VVRVENGEVPCEKNTQAVWSYMPPVIYNVSLQTQGGNLTIEGENFGDNSTLLQVAINGSPCNGCSIAYPHLTIRCEDCPGGEVGVLYNISLSVDDLLAEAFAFSYSEPLPSGIQNSHKGHNTPAIVGGVIGGLVGVAAIAGAAIVFSRHRRPTVSANFDYDVGKKARFGLEAFRQSFRAVVNT